MSEIVDSLLNSMNTSFLNEDEYEDDPYPLKYKKLEEYFEDEENTKINEPEEDISYILQMDNDINGITQLKCYENIDKIFENDEININDFFLQFVEGLQENSKINFNNYNYFLKKLNINNISTLNDNTPGPTLTEAKQIAPYQNKISLDGLIQKCKEKLLNILKPTIDLDSLNENNVLEKLIEGYVSKENLSYFGLIINIILRASLTIQNDADIITIINNFLGKTVDQAKQNLASIIIENILNLPNNDNCKIQLEILKNDNLLNKLLEDGNTIILNSIFNGNFVGYLLENNFDSINMLKIENKNKLKLYESLLKTSKNLDQINELKEIFAKLFKDHSFDSTEGYKAFNETLEKIVTEKQEEIKSLEQKINSKEGELKSKDFGNQDYLLSNDIDTIKEDNELFKETIKLQQKLCTKTSKDKITDATNEYETKCQTYKKQIIGFQRTAPMLIDSSSNKNPLLKNEYLNEINLEAFNTLKHKKNIWNFLNNSKIDPSSFDKIIEKIEEYLKNQLADNSLDEEAIDTLTKIQEQIDTCKEYYNNVKDTDKLQDFIKVVVDTFFIKKTLSKEEERKNKMNAIKDFRLLGKNVDNIRFIHLGLDLKELENIVKKAEMPDYSADLKDTESDYDVSKKKVDTRRVKKYEIKNANKILNTEQNSGCSIL